MHIRSLVSFLIFIFATISVRAGEFDWVVTKDWTPGLEKKFSEFVRVMGESGCRSMTACLTSSASNPLYHSKTPRNRSYPADCADLPYALRMYFAWMEGLPFDYVSSPAQANPAKETNKDIRYTKFGNKPGSVRRIVRGKTYDAYRELMNLRNSVSTATYRMHYDFITDFYPTKVDRSFVVPGTVVYDPAGHAAIVYKVEADGRLRMMDAHPDNSITRITYDEKFVRSRPAHGAGLRNWRPELDTSATKLLSGFSAEQFEGTFQVSSERVGYYDWVRTRLAGGTLKFKPVEELRNKMSELCSNIQDRDHAVRAALSAKIQNQPQPEKLPVNIYGTNGVWEEYSTPSRDARLKVAFVELRKDVERQIELYRQGSTRIVYTPTPSRYSKDCRRDDHICFLIADLKSAYADLATKPECGVTYTKSDGETQVLTYSDLAARLFKLSFDPYHCAELRWGASDQELTTCPDDRNKMDWYQAQQRLRNQIERTYDARMDYDLRGTATKLGVASPPDVDVWGYLHRVQD